MARTPILQKQFDASGLDKNTQEAIDWFYQKATKLSYSKAARADLSDLMKNGKLKGGNLVIFNYTPKNKDTLQWYDCNPMVILFGVTSKYMIGLNLHYIPPKLRKKVLEKVWGDTMLFGEKPLKAKWKKLIYLLGKRICEQCVKMYLVENVSNIGQVEETEWIHVFFLPLAKFAKASPRKAWSTY